MNGSTPLASTLTSQRPRDFRVCYDSDSGSNVSTANVADARRKPWGVAPIDFTYSIETNFSLLSLSLREKETLLPSVSAAIIESVYEYDCLSQRRRKRRRQSAVSSLLTSSVSSSRRAEILSVGPGIGHEWLGECGDISFSNNNDEKNDYFCIKIRGTVVIAFDGEEHPESTIAIASDFKSVGDVVLSRIEEDMINGNYVDKINNDLLMFGLTIISMKYIDSNYPGLVAQGAFGPLNSNSGLETAMVRVDTVGMTLFSKVAIPIMVILFLLAMGLCWCAVLSCPADLFFAKTRSRNQESGDNKDEDSRNHSRSNSGREGEIGYRNNSIPFSITNIDKKNADIRRNEKYRHKGSRESSRTLSLEATLQDLSDIEVLKYGNQNPVHSMSSGNQSTMHVVDGNSHPSDTETGSSSPSVEICNDIKDDVPTGIKVDLMNVPYREVADGSLSAKKAKFNSTPIRAISSFFSKSISSTVPQGPTSTINLMDRISSCTSIPNNHCLGDEQELQPRTTTNGTNTNSTVLRYIIPTVERCNSLMEEESEPPALSRKSVPNKAGSPLSRMGSKKSAAYREYINQKILQRKAGYEQSDTSMSMQIGVKRTFTDSQGRIREMVAL